MHNNYIYIFWILADLSLLLILQYKYKVIRGGYRRDFTLAARNTLKTTMGIDMKVEPKNRWKDLITNVVLCLKGKL